MLEVFIDGGCAPKNPGGTASWAFIVTMKHLDPVQPVGTTEVTEYLFEKCGVVGTGPGMSNNVGEYTALLEFLKWFDTQPTEEVVIKSDSQLLINQMQGKFKVNKGTLCFPYYSKVQILRLQNSQVWKDKIKFEWIPREQNEADRLTKQALREVGL